MRDTEQTTTRMTTEFAVNPEILGRIADRCSGRLGFPCFAEYEKQRLTPPLPPLRPIQAVYDGPIEMKRVAFDTVNRENNHKYDKARFLYEKIKRQHDLLNLYPADMAGYGKYLSVNYQVELAFFGERRTFHLAEGSRRLHTYVTGGSGSGKSELLKSFAWDIIGQDPACALVFIDPHSDVAKQVARFRPNRDNGRLVYVEPRIDDAVFPGLNPFDVGGKESLTDMQAEAYASEFIMAFREILKGELTDQMETLLKNTIPVLIRMPGASVYDLIKFLRPPARDVRGKRKAESGDESEPVEYEAQRYLDFAKANCRNREMLRFLSGQFENDASYALTRNGLTTRLMLVFGSTLMQALFRGPRTVRLEELIPQRKIIVFNLADLQEATGTVGRFVLISLKIFALNQSKVKRALRTPCHVLVDECQQFVTGSMREILQEARKFRVYLTLAQQSAGGGMLPDLFDAVRTNSATKIAGTNSGTTLDIMSRETGIPAETIAAFKPGQFAIYQRAATPRCAVVSMPTNTLADRAGMDAADWKVLVRSQMELYYRAPESPDPEFDDKGGEPGSGLLEIDLAGHMN